MHTKSLSLNLHQYHFKEESMSDEMKRCPTCECPYGYALRENIYACPECSHEWDTKEAEDDFCKEIYSKELNLKYVVKGVLTKLI